MTALEAKDAGFLPVRIAQYAQQIDDGAQKQAIDPIWVCAIGETETAWGTSKQLDIKGPKGTGDFFPRQPKRFGYAMPPDGRGWGRGLMQIDYGSHKEFCLKKAPDGRFLWEIPEENIAYGCGILHSCLTSLRQYDAATAAYNAGAGAAFRALQEVVAKGVDRRKALDAVTFTKNYVSIVMRLMDQFSGKTVKLAARP